MSALLELIFQGFFEWIYGLILEVWEYISGNLLDIMSMDFAYLQTHIPILPTIRQSMLAVGWALLIGNLVFQAARSMMTGLGFEAEDPKLLFTRTFVFSFLLMASPQICDICLDMTSTVIGIMRVPNAVNIQLIQESAFDGLACAWLLVFICGIIVMFQSFKLIFEMAERYFILAVLTICAPLAFGMGGSRNTTDIFTGWCRMYGSMCLLMVLNVVFVKMLLAVLSTVPTGLSVLPWIVLVLTIVKVAKKADAIVTRIGLNPAITGDSLGRMFPGMLTYIVTRTAMSQVTKAIGKNTGRDSGSRSPNAPNGGGPNNGGPRSGAAAKGRSRRNGNAGHSQQSTSQQNTEQQSVDRQSTTQQSSSQKTAAQGAQSRMGSNRPVTIIPDDAEDAAMNGPAPTPGVTTQPQSTDQAGKRAERQSSVPSGAVRSPSFVRQGGAASTIAKRISTSSSATNTGRNTSSQPAHSSASADVMGSGTRTAAHAGSSEKGDMTGVHEVSANGRAGNEPSASRFSRVQKQMRGSVGAERAKSARGATPTPERTSAKTGASIEQRTDQTRFTQRDAMKSTAERQARTPAQQESKPYAQAASAGKGQQRPAPPGIAGTGEPIAARQTLRGERPGRNTPSSGSGVDSLQWPSPTAPAQQGRVTSPSAAVTDKGQASIIRSGKAETDAPQTSRASIRGERRGRNAPPPGSGVGGSQQPSPAAPARQERAASQSVVAADKGQTPVMRSGTAGINAPQSSRLSAKAERPGRNVTDLSARAAITAKASDTARQESRPHAQAAPHDRGTGVPIRSGTAGTADAGARPAQKAPTAQNLSSGSTPRVSNQGANVKPLTAAKTGSAASTRKSAVKKGGRKKHGR